MKKNYAYLSLLTCILCTSLFSQSQNWAWARAGNGIGTASEEAKDVAIDLAGNVFITGSFSGPGITFTSPALSTTLTNSDNSGTQEIFLAKYDASGNLLWALSAAGSDHDQGRAVSTDAAGNVYLTGFFQSPTLAFGTTTLVNNSNTGLADIYVAKFDPAGNLIWASRHGGALSEWGMDIAVDAPGNIYLTGFFNSLQVIFGSVSVINSGSSDAYVAKLNTNGVGQWAMQTGGSQPDMGVSISVDANSDVYVVGDFQSSSLGFSPNLINAGGSDIFFVKYSSTGNTLLSKSFGGAGDEDAWSIANDMAGNIFITGRYTSNPLVIGSTSLSRIGPMDMFTAAFDPTGSAMWAKRNNGNQFSSPKSVQADLAGNLYVAGSAVNLFPLSFGTTTLTSNNSAAAYLVKYNALTGVDLWGTTVDVRAENMHLDLFGNIHLVGSYGGTVAIGTTTLNGGVQSEAFVAKMCNLPVIPGTSITVCAGLTGTLNVTIPPGFIPKWFTSALGGSLVSTGNSSISSAATGTFYLELTDTVAGCGFTGPRVAMTVSVHPQPFITVSGGSLSTNASGNVTLQWYDCTYGSVIGGANGNTFFPPAPSNYAVIVTVDNCVDTSDCFRFPPVGINANSTQENEIKIYPNPNNGSFVIDAIEEGSCEIINVLGEKIKRLNLVKGVNQVKLNDLISGVYFVEIGDEIRRLVISN